MLSLVQEIRGELIDQLASGADGRQLRHDWISLSRRQASMMLAILDHFEELDKGLNAFHKAFKPSGHQSSDRP